MAKAAALTAAGALGMWAALDIPLGSADPPVGGTIVNYVTVTETVNRRLDHRGIWWWRDRAISNKREANAQRITLRRIRRFMYVRWDPTVDYALALARAVYGYDLSHRAWCESKHNPFAANRSGALGLMQFLRSTWATTPFASFSPFDPVAAALAGGWMISAGRSGEWTCGL